MKPESSVEACQVVGVVRSLEYMFGRESLYPFSGLYEVTDPFGISLHGC